MEKTTVKTSLIKPVYSVKVQAFATICGIVAAVALPQIFHLIGAASGMGTLPGETYLPMHLPILLVGLLAGPWVGALSGALGPLASSLMSGMPGPAMLPFMMIELCGYGLVAGLLRNNKMPTLAKVVIAQVAGRAVRALAILFAVYALGNEKIAIATIWASIPKGLFGLALQWTILPLIVYRVENAKKSE